MADDNDEAPLTHTEQAMAYYAGDLSPEDKAAFEQHLAGCAECQRLLEEAKATLPLVDQILAFQPKHTVEEQVQRFDGMRSAARGRKMKARLAVAAGLVLAMGVAAWLVLSAKPPVTPAPLPVPQKRLNLSAPMQNP